MNRIHSLLLTSCLLGLMACKSTDAISSPSSGAQQAAGTPEEDSRALLLGLAEVATPTPSCDALVTALDSKLRSESGRISRLATATGPSTGELTAEQETKATAFVARVKQCAGTPGAARLADSVKALQAQRGGPASGARTSSSCNCNDFCVSGWKTWAEVSAMSVACLAGDNQACCTFTAIASHSACIKTYCPTENCCLDVPTSVPQH